MRDTIRKVVLANDEDDLIPPTQGQEIDNLSTIAIPQPGTSGSSGSSAGNRQSTFVEEMMSSFYKSDKGPQVHQASIEEKISLELQTYNRHF